MNHDTTNGRRTDDRTDKHELGVETDAADCRETPTANSWRVDRRTFVKAGTLLGLGGLSAPVTAQTADHLTAEQAAQWFTEMKLTASDATSGDEFGRSVSVSRDGTTALIGAPRDDEPSITGGAAYVYDLSGSSPSETQLIDSDADFDFKDRFGKSVSVSGDGTTALVGAFADDDADAGRYSNMGSAYVFTRHSADQPPTASFTYDPTTPTVGEAVTFDASASSDSDGTIASYEWEFGDGATGTGQMTAHSYTAEGDYEVKLTVTDESGASETATQRVEVMVFAEALVVKGESYLPQDLDGDGLYEDITGDGAMTKDDSRALDSIIKAHRKGAVTLTDAQVAALDFNGDGHLSPSDKGAYKRSQRN